MTLAQYKELIDHAAWAFFWCSLTLTGVAFVGYLVLALFAWIVKD